MFERRKYTVAELDVLTVASGIDAAGTMDTLDGKTARAETRARQAAACRSLVARIAGLEATIERVRDVAAAAVYFNGVGHPLQVSAAEVLAALTPTPEGSDG